MRETGFAAGFSAGGIETEDITFNGRDVPVHYEGAGDQLLVSWQPEKPGIPIALPCRDGRKNIRTDSKMTERLTGFLTRLRPGSK